MATSKKPETLVNLKRFISDFSFFYRPEKISFLMFQQDNLETYNLTGIHKIYFIKPYYNDILCKVNLKV